MRNISLPDPKNKSPPPQIMPLILCFPFPRYAYALEERTRSISQNITITSKPLVEKIWEEKTQQNPFTPCSSMCTIDASAVPPPGPAVRFKSIQSGARALVDRTQQLSLKDKFPLLVLLRHLKRLIVLPPHRLFTLPALNIPHNVFARSHVSFYRFRLGYVYYRVE